MHIDVKDWVTSFELCEKRVPLPYDNLLESITVSHLWQQVGMDISYIPKAEDGYHLLVVAMGISQRMGRGTTTKSRHVRESLRHRV